MDRNSRTGAIPRRSRPLGANPRPRTGALLRALLAAGVLSLSAGAARASVLVSIDKSTQRMSVSVDGVPRYHWAVSTGRAGYGTPSGTYRPQRMERTWFSKEYYNSPMPHSIFFHGGYAIHGSYEIHRLGGPASHGCIRLHPANAATLFAVVKQRGMSDTTMRLRRSPVIRSAPTRKKLSLGNLQGSCGNNPLRGSRCAGYAVTDAGRGSGGRYLAEDVVCVFIASSSAQCLLLHRLRR